MTVIKLLGYRQGRRARGASFGAVAGVARSGPQRDQLALGAVLCQPHGARVAEPLQLLARQDRAGPLAPGQAARAAPLEQPPALRTARRFVAAVLPRGVPR